MSYAEVAVDAPLGVDRTLTYSLPPRLPAMPGQMVWAPLGPRPVQGMVFAVTGKPQVESPRPIISTIEPASLVSPFGLELARWMSRRYLSTLFECVSLMLPPGFRDRVDSHLTPGDAEPRSLAGEEDEVWRFLIDRGRTAEKEVRRSLGAKFQPAINRLVRRGALRREWEMPRPRTAPAYDAFLLPHPEGGEAGLLAPNAPRQAALLEAATRAPHRLSRSHANKEYGSGAVEALIKKGLLAQEWVRRDGSAGPDEGVEQASPLTLSPEQAEALSHVAALIERETAGPRTVLLHGVTGSGKTEVYLRALERCVAAGRRGILLAPEISLTPQLADRLNARFPGRVALLHSGLTVRERFNAWWRVRDGAYDVVVGPRSALFAPMPDLGLIVVDEEHEWTYKEQDRPPRYHARAVAMRMSQASGAPLVMGSATPDVSTYYHARQGRHRLFHLPYRIGAGPRPPGSPKDGAGLARVEVLDMRQELKEGNRSPFSRRLVQALREGLGRGEQAIIFLNRRGAAALVQCRDCGASLECRRCAVALTYHGARGLLCHLCNRRARAPSRCRGCGSANVRYLGIGVQRLVELLKEVTPDAEVARWDSDAVREAGGHAGILNAFAGGQAQVLVGTQMVAKGLHMPNVTLVGVALADVGLYLPDFRAGERTFQLLCQVAGRAGRGAAPGRVIIQTYSPDNYAVQAAGRQDYGGFYEKEIAYRRQLRNPPFSSMVNLVYLHTSEEACEKEARRLSDSLRSTAYAQGLSAIEFIGPAPGHPQRARGRYRWRVILRGSRLQDIHRLLSVEPAPKGWTVDVDPVTLL